jgi:hypothetical protein
MHLVMSARSGTNAIAFRNTAREVLASEFAGHEYFFAVHSDLGCVSACNWCPPDSVIGAQSGTTLGHLLSWSFVAGGEAEDDDGGDGWADEAGVFCSEVVGARDRPAAACIEEDGPQGHRDRGWCVQL